MKILVNLGVRRLFSREGKNFPGGGAARTNFLLKLNCIRIFIRIFLHYFLITIPSAVALIIALIIYIYLRKLFSFFLDMYRVCHGFR